MNPPRKSFGAQARGFTLVEVLVALVIMAVIAGMAWQGIDALARTRATTEERMEKTLRLNTALAQWEQDLTAVVDTGAVPRALDFDGSSLRLTRRTESGVQLVVWSLHGPHWLRWAGPVVTLTGDLQQNWLRSQQLQ